MVVEDLKIDGKLIKETIDKLGQLLSEFYVYPELATEMCRKLQTIFFDGVTRASTFCEEITKQLQMISNDMHLHVSYNTAEEKPSNSNDRTESSTDPRKTELMLDNYGFVKVERLPGNIGYLELHAFAPPEIAGETAVSAMNFLANTSGMIIDLRKSGGWSPAMVAFLSSYLLGDSPVHLNDLYWRNTNITQSSWSMPFVPGKRFGAYKPVIILTSKQTFSASEEFAYNLQAIKRAQVVGEITGGGAHPGGVHRLNNYFEVFIPSGRAINPTTKTNWEGTGVLPDIEVNQEKAFDIAYDAILQLGLEQMLENPTCGEERLIQEMKSAMEYKRLNVC
ncbi:S41 family peptidase [Paenibacillus montanisoli]|uniref:Tail specific protease domain-containing protein n=1 Tax=Paenibacillus montanisoli TaxID=2081970 RepID=A0A328U231_9BACL|nr:S41 family peptidase [Paenibacillus montanisoli]RAP76112.1 hypothetical protein DL346_11885 [Paenibacillus montanisoli]